MRYNPAGHERILARADGPYEVLGLVGAGGMGTVYGARDTRLQRLVAIKIDPNTDVGEPARTGDSSRKRWPPRR